MQIASTSTGQLIDKLGLLKAQAAEAAASQKEIVAVLIEREGDFKGEGELFRLALSLSNSSSCDKDAVITQLAKDAGYTDKRLDNLYEKHTSRSTKWVPKVSARVTK